MIGVVPKASMGSDCDVAAGVAVAADGAAVTA
jgi:hypothetical protein